MSEEESSFLKPSKWIPPRPWTEEETKIAGLLNSLMEAARILTFEEFEAYTKKWFEIVDRLVLA